MTPRIERMPTAALAGLVGLAATAGTAAAIDHPGGARGSRSIDYRPRVVLVLGPDGRLYPYAAPLIVVSPGIAPYPPPLVGPIVPTPGGMVPPDLTTPRVDLDFDSNPALPALPDPPIAANAANAAANRPRRAEADRVKRLISYGDNSFRARNLARARLRYQQAAAADPGAAAPRIGLAQVALAEGDFREAAHRFREALAADRDYLAHAPDVEGLWGEAADFDRAVDRLESHLQAHPQDRDAWLALGAEWFLSGRIPQSADVFLRLSDRRGDPALTAFLKATAK